IGAPASSGRHPQTYPPPGCQDIPRSRGLTEIPPHGRIAIRPRRRRHCGRNHPCRATVRSVEISLERVAGIEPAYSAWKAAALPLSYTREPAGSDGGGGWIRTSVRISGQIYSLMDLTTLPPLRVETRRSGAVRIPWRKCPPPASRMALWRHGSVLST